MATMQVAPALTPVIPTHLDFLVPNFYLFFIFQYFEEVSGSQTFTFSIFQYFEFEFQVPGHSSRHPLVRQQSDQARQVLSR